MKVLAVYNLKGGVGKTAGAVNLSWFAAQAGLRTLVWDLDPQGAATFYFRVKPGVKGGGRGMLRRRRRSLSRQIRATDFDRLDLVPSDLSNRNFDLYLARKKNPLNRLRWLLQTVRDDYDLVFLDCAPGLSLVSEAVFEAADALLLPTIPTPLSMRALKQVRRHVRKIASPPLLLPYFTMVDQRRSLHREFLTNDLGDDFLRTNIPYSSQVERMGTRREPLPAFAPRHAATAAHRKLWDELAARLRLSREPPGSSVFESGSPQE